VTIEGAVSVPVVFDNGSDLVIAAASADLPQSAFAPTVQQLAQNIRTSGRNSENGLVRVRLRRVEAQPSGGSKPVVLAEATRSLATGAVSLDQG
jgi:hypothetical protein